MSYRRDINDEKEWSEMDIADLRNHVARGWHPFGASILPLCAAVVGRGLRPPNGQFTRSWPRVAQPPRGLFCLHRIATKTKIQAAMSGSAVPAFPCQP
jgi:hypothetical protein